MSLKKGLQGPGEGRCRASEAAGRGEAVGSSASRPYYPACPHPLAPQVWLGSFPIVINFWAAMSITVYYAATLCLM